MSQEAKQKFAEQFQPQINENVSSKVQSSYQTEYSAFFEEIPGCQSEKQKLVVELAKKGGIYYSNKTTKNQIQISLIDHSSTFEVMRFGVELRAFSMYIVLLNAKGKSPAHILRNVSSTNAGVYKDSAALEGSVVKCLPIKNQTFPEQLISAIKEFSILRIAAFLGVGPCLTPLFGFDLIVYEDCIEFCMQECQSTDSLDATQRLQLKQKLHRLHMLQIVHVDIKPANVAMSPLLSEAVFIDFGFSEVLQQKLGLLTLTSFIGSLSHCSPQMFNCYNTSQSQMVDLYYNDAHALKKTFSELSQEANVELQSLSQSPQYFTSIRNIEHEQQMRKKFSLIHLKYQIYMSSNEVLANKKYHPSLWRNTKAILEYVDTLNASQYLQKLCTFFQQNKEILKQSKQRKNIANFKTIHYGLKYETNNECSLRYRHFLEKVKISKILIKNPMLGFQDQNMKEVLLTKQIAQRIERQIYFQHFVNFTNFRKSLSTFREKVQASLILVQLFNLSFEYKENEINLIEFSMRYLISYYTQSEDQNCYRTLPILLCNLIIIDQISEDQIIGYLENIADRKSNNLHEYAMMMFRCFLMEEWIKAKVSAKYNIWSLVDKMQKTILGRLKKLNETLEQKNSYFVFMILKMIAFTISYSHFSVIDQKEISQLHIDFIEKVKQNAIWIEPFSRRQILIHLFYLKIKQYTAKNRFSEVIICIKQIKGQQQYMNQDYAIFDYYHFFIIPFFAKSNNLKSITYLISNLKTCLGTDQLMQKYMIYVQYPSIELKSKGISVDFYRFILKRLKDNLREKEGELIIIINKILLMKALKRNELGKQELKVIEQIIKQLKSIYPINSQSKFNQKWEYVGINYYEFCYNKIRIIYQLYGPILQLFVFFQHLRQQYLSLFANIVCKYCRQMAEGYLVVTQAYILSIINKTDEVVTLYQRFIDNRSGSNHSVHSMIILEILMWFISKQSERYQYNQQIIAPLYKWLKQNDSWGDLFAVIPKTIDTLQAIYQYLQKNAKFQEFCNVNFKLIQFISMYPLKEYINSYSHCLMQSLGVYRTNLSQLLDYIRNNKILENQSCEYFIIFKVIMLFFWPINIDQIRKILNGIHKNIEKVTLFAKIMVKNHLFNQLIKLQLLQFSQLSRKERISKSKQIKYHYKMNLKHTKTRFNWKDFSNYFCNVSYLKAQQTKKHQYLVKHAKFYFRNIRMKQIQKKYTYFFGTPSYQKIDIHQL